MTYPLTTILLMGGGVAATRIRVPEAIFEFFTNATIGGSVKDFN